MMLISNSRTSTNPKKNSNLKSRSFRYGCLLLSFALVFLCSFSVFAAVVDSGSISIRSFNIAQLGSSSETLTLYDYSEANGFGFNKFASVYNIGRGDFRTLTFYDVSVLSSFSQEGYILLETQIGLSRNGYVNNLSNHIYFYDSNYNSLLSSSVDRSTELVTIVFQTIDYDIYKNYIAFKLEDLSILSDLKYISIRQDFNTLDSTSVSFFLGDLKYTVHDNTESLLTDINSSLNSIQDQNNIVIQNLTDVKNQLNSIHDSLSSNSAPGISGTDDVIQNTESVEGILNDGLADFLEKPVVDDVLNGLDLILTAPRISAAFIFWGDLLGLAVDSVFPLQLVLTVAAGLIIVSSLFALFRSPLSGERDADRLNAESQYRLSSVERQSIRDQHNRYRGG